MILASVRKTVERQLASSELRGSCPARAKPVAHAARLARDDVPAAFEPHQAGTALHARTGACRRRAFSRRPRPVPQIAEVGIATTAAKNTPKPNAAAMPEPEPRAIHAANAPIVIDTVAKIAQLIRPVAFCLATGASPRTLLSLAINSTTSAPARSPCGIRAGRASCSPRRGW